jgi:acylphosphatase
VILRFLVSGVVQGVGFRYFVLRRATSLGLAGWTRNLPDGRVEVVAKGESGDLAALEEALRQGPRHSRVADVEKTQISDEVDLAIPFQIK